MGSARNRRDRAQRQRRRAERRRHGKLARLFDEVPAPLRRPPPGSPKMSEVITEFARPLLDAAPEDAGLEDFRARLLLAAAAWNILVGLEGKDTPAGQAVDVDADTVDQFVADIAAAAGVSEEAAFELLEVLAARKRELFPEERRFLAGVEAREHGDRVHVVAMTMLPR